MKTINELQELIIEWAKDKNLNNPDKQYFKFQEECGEFSKAVLTGEHRINVLNEIGDIAVTLIINYWQENKRIFTEEIQCSKQSSKDALKDINWCLVEMDSEVLDYVEDLAYNYNSTLQECLNLAWNKISKRKGKTVNGTFIKEM